MGILDDAIREHLELKRKHGASGDDLERLEKEAFGPAERPGPETGEEQLPEQDEDEYGAHGEDQPDRDDSFEDDSADEADFAIEEDESPESEPIADETSPAERARVEHADLGDTVDHPAVPQPSEDGEPEAGTAQAHEPAETAIFDEGDDEIGDEDFGDIDLELDLEDEPGSPAASEPPTPEAGDQAPSRAQPEGDFLADDEEEDAVEDDDEDLLEETPEFLQDTPEDERLWFEQGAPKDFDFDDDD